MTEIHLRVGMSDWAVRAPNGCLVPARPRVEPSAIADLAAAVRNALDNPYRLGFPLRRGLTPDDRIALVIDERLPQLGELLTEVLRYLATTGIGPDSVTILTESAAGAPGWIDELPDEFADVHTENHQPGDRKLLSYLATTKKGRRVYLNRTLVDADQIISISGRRYDPLLGYAGCEGAIYPALGDAETRQAMWDELTLAAPTAEPFAMRAEASEIAFLLSSAIYIQVVEGHGDSIACVGAGFVDSSAMGIAALDERWRCPVPAPVDVALAAIAGDPRRVDFSTLALAALGASRAVKDNGVIVILTEGEPVHSESMELIRKAEEPAAALRLLATKKPSDMAAGFAWTSIVESKRIYLASGLRPEIAEELFGTPVVSPVEVQHLLDLGGSCLVLPDAHKGLAEVGGVAQS